MKQQERNRGDIELSSVESPVMICAPAAARPVSERERGPEDRERCEDGADDHPLKYRAANSRVCGRQGRTQSRRGAAASE
jgi:hypothetical protein